MNATTLIKLRQRSNILVTEQVKQKEAVRNIKTKAKLWSDLLLPDIIPIFKALVIVTLFLISGLGYTPLGCKTQYLFSDRYWYNKQLIIFFIIYFIVNIRGEAVTELTNPLQEFILSVITWILFNMIASLGKIWLAKTPWYWPGPLTWFGAIALPLVTMYILDDMRRYFIAEHALKDSETKINIIKNVEMGIILLVFLMLIIGFIKAFNAERNAIGKTFQFLPFFFGFPQTSGNKTLSTKCTKATFIKINKEIKKSAGQLPQPKGKLLLMTGLFISTILGFGYILPNYAKLSKKIKNVFQFITKPKKTFTPNVSVALDKASLVLKAPAVHQKYHFQHL